MPPRAMLTLLATHTLIDQAQAAPQRRLQFARLFNKEDSVPGGACEDKNEDCDGWATEGECESNPGYMNTECPLSCKRCTALANATRPKRRRPPARTGCHDEEGFGCAAKAKARAQEINPNSLTLTLTATLNLTLTLPFPVTGDPDPNPNQAGGCDTDKGEMLPRCPKTCNVCNFMSTIVEAFGCDDKHPTCKSWASQGECDKNKGFMSEQVTQT